MNGKKVIVQVEHMVNAINLGAVNLKQNSLKNYLKILGRMGLTVVDCNITPSVTVNQMLPRLNPHNCVSLTKACLGIKPWGIYTPYRLFKALVKRDDCCCILNPVN